MTREEALALSREVVAGKTRSYVGAARDLARFLLEEERAAAEMKARLEESHRIQRAGNAWLDEAPDDHDDDH